jgi:preprotein translocase subunit SecF
MQLFKTPHINFMKFKYAALAFTALIVLAGILNWTLFHGLKPGVDFGGGTLLRIDYKDTISVGQVRKQLSDAGLGNCVIQETGRKGHEFQIRATQVVKASDEKGELEAHEKMANTIIDALRAGGPADRLTVISRETVGPQAGKELRKKATAATLWALVAMLIYIAVRFKLEYGIAAIFTLTQDVLITLGIYSFTNREINLPIIAAFLTIVGYSINDTIVIFDRIRENTKLYRKDSLEQIMNLALNQTLGRTIITSGTVFLTLLALYLFGGEVINDFAFIMLIGTIEGVYSTIFMACPVVLVYQKAFKTQKGFKR